jgi:flavin reductase (DIM6/NTAB) family NADH-FMN oxidoreductase RutF
MAKVYLTETELEALYEAEGALLPLAHTLGSPMPQVLLVTADPSFEDGSISVRTATLTPLSWGPYTKAVSVPLDDEKVVRALREPRAQCVLGLPSRGMLRQLTICAQRLPPGISEADVARLTMLKSLYVDVPGIADCPVNFECAVEHLETYHGHLVTFLRVVGASIDDRMLFLERDEIVSIFPTNAVDQIVDQDGAVRTRVSLLSDLFLCPTFPVAPKQGWYGTFEIWMRDLADEGYMSGAEHEQVMAWHGRWQEVFADLGSAERAELRETLTELIRLIARQRWPEVHALLSSRDPG